MIDFSSVFGTLLALAGVVGGQLLEGGSLGQLAQATAALIVLGGTLGATLLAFPGADTRRALGMIPLVYLDLDVDVRPVIEEIVRIATLARKEGVLAVEAQRQSIRDPLFRKFIKFVIDGFEPSTVRDIMDAEIEISYEREEAAARVVEGAGGFAPTIGILGAVLGLIHVMTMLSDPSKIGEGIAVAFVATVYGVGLANLILLPWAAKLKRRAESRRLSQEIVKMGVMGILEGLNPHFLQAKLEIFGTSAGKD